MPYILISTQIRLECGPTFVGDGLSDPDLMEYLNATPSKQLGNEFKEYVTPHAPRIVLNMLEVRGWKVIGMAGIGQTCAWTLYQSDNIIRVDVLVPIFQVIIMVQNATLVKVAAGTFLAGATGLYLAQKSVQWKVRKLHHYIESLHIVGEHEQAKNALGPPIKIGAVDLADNFNNYVGKTRSKLRIPVTGSVDCGHMDVMAVRNDPSKEFVTAKITLTLHDGAVTIYDNSLWADTDDVEV